VYGNLHSETVKLIGNMYVLLRLQPVKGRTVSINNPPAREASSATAAV